MKTAWTPGPWDVEDDYRPGMAWNRLVVHGAAGESRICFMAHSDDGKSPEAHKANAYLIAAAPELYAALAQVLHELIEAGFNTAKDFNWPQAIADARAALAKARGEP